MWVVLIVLSRRPGSLPGPRHSLPPWAVQVVSSFSRIYLLPTLAFSRWINTLNRLLSGSALGDSWRWFCVTLDQSHNLILKYGGQLYFVHFYTVRGMLQCCLFVLSSPDPTSQELLESVQYTLGPTGWRHETGPATSFGTGWDISQLRPQLAFSAAPAVAPWQARKPRMA